MGTDAIDPNFYSNGSMQTYRLSKLTCFRNVLAELLQLETE